jgi:hypothetical protein
MQEEMSNLTTVGNAVSSQSVEESQFAKGNDQRDQVRTFYFKAQSRVEHVARVGHAPGP